MNDSADIFTECIGRKKERNDRFISVLWPHRSFFLPCDARPILHAAALELVVLLPSGDKVVLPAEDVLGPGQGHQEQQEHHDGL